MIIILVVLALKGLYSYVCDFMVTILHLRPFSSGVWQVRTINLYYNNRTVQAVVELKNK